MLRFAKRRTTVKKRRQAIKLLLAARQREQLWQPYQLKRLFYFGLCCALMLIAVSLRHAHLFPLHRVKFVGPHPHESAEQLRAIVQPFAQYDFFSVDVPTMQARFKQLPWVDRVQIRRIWPDQLVIHLIEHVAVASWQKNSLFSASGELFYPPHASLPASLPALHGVAGHEQEVFSTLQLMQQALAPTALTIVRLEQNPRSAWQAVLSNGMVLVLGRQQPMQRLQRFVVAYRQLLQTVPQVKIIDLRYSNGMAVG